MKTVILIGKEGAGKSALFDAMKYLKCTVKMLDINDSQSLFEGAKHADCAVLLFNVANLNSDKIQVQTKMIYALGLPLNIVCITGMDKVSWSQTSFNAAVVEVTTILRRTGYNIRNIAFLPICSRVDDENNLIVPSFISCPKGANLVDYSPHMPWFQYWKRETGRSGEKKGRTFIEALDSIDMMKLEDKPLRISVEDAYVVKERTLVLGTVECGILDHEKPIFIVPGNLETKIHEIQNGNGKPREKIAFFIDNVMIRKGSVCGPCPPNLGFLMETLSFCAFVVVSEGREISLKDYEVEVHNARVMAQLTEFIARVDRRTGNTIDSSPCSLKSGDAGIVRFKPKSPFFIEVFSAVPSLSRLSIRDYDFVAFGITKSVEQKK